MNKMQIHSFTSHNNRYIKQISSKYLRLKANFQLFHSMLIIFILNPMCWSHQTQKPQVTAAKGPWFLLLCFFFFLCWFPHPPSWACSLLHYPLWASAMKPVLRARLMGTRETVRNVCAVISFSGRALETCSNQRKIIYLFICYCIRVTVCVCVIFYFLHRFLCHTLTIIRSLRLLLLS